ncbi:MAG TPA: tRNA uridine-5-carboxymethylaminomethyl(34) synthesis GTPase MnmE [Candidatus Binatia bacterium]|nr:tRNA uridine-5-carboxymethylaminomethyl(34) synthesis GTPase MnmE [Candidatus Binatia bacterium]
MYKEDTIAAIATPVGEGGVAIIRLSGPDAERIATSLFARSRANNGKLRSHTLYHGSIRDPKTNKLVDEVLLTIMRKPRSYTGEDVVEIHCHGGGFVVRRLLGLVLLHGGRQAEPGEFTKRAFLNGRLDLAQAEGILDLVRARTDKGLELAFDQVSGELSKWVGELREELLDILVQVEAAIDFPEEDVELLQDAELKAKINALRTKINTISDTYEWGRLFREGARVCICGRPNVGKSSLLNALIGEERVIVTPIPGTTRDVIEEAVNLGGLPVILWDTAGIRHTDNPVEKIGVNLSREHLDKADAALLVLDGSEPLAEEDHALLALVSGKKTLVVINKNDLPRKLPVAELEERTGLTTVLPVSAKLGEGLERLRKCLKHLVLGAEIEPTAVITNLRHRTALLRSYEALSRALATLERSHPPELIAVDLNEAREALEEIVGAVNNENILERIFASFCIGK